MMEKNFNYENLHKCKYGGKCDANLGGELTCMLV